MSKRRPGLEKTSGYLKDRLRTHSGRGASKLVAINVLRPRKKAGTVKTRVAVFVFSYRCPYSPLCLFLSPTGQYRSVLPNTWPTGFICIAEPHLYLLYTSKWEVRTDALPSFGNQCFGGKCRRIAVVVDWIKHQHETVPSQKKSKKTANFIGPVQCNN